MHSKTDHTISLRGASPGKLHCIISSLQKKQFHDNIGWEGGGGLNSRLSLRVKKHLVVPHNIITDTL